MHQNQIEPNHLAATSQPQRELMIELGEMFQGPLPVLLALASKEEVPAHEIPLQTLVQQYVAFKDEETRKPLEHGSEFISACSTLHYLKSSSLVSEYICDLEIAEDNEQTENSDIAAPSDDLLMAEKLMKALYEYGQLKNWAHSLSLLEKEERRSFTRPDGIYGPFQRRLPSELPCSVEDLASLFQTLIEKKRNRPVHHVGQDAWTIEEAITIVIQKVLDRKEEGLLFIALFEGNQDNEIPIDSCISLFLALLELIKQGTIHVFFTRVEKDLFSSQEELHPILLHTSFIGKKREGMKENPNSVDTQSEPKKSRRVRKA